MIRKDITRKFDIVLVSPPTRAYSHIVPFPCIYLAGFLEERGVRCSIIDFKSDILRIDEAAIEEKTVREIVRVNAPYVGFTCLSAEFYCVTRMIKKIRELGYKGKIIVGGHHPTFYPTDFIYEGTLVDFCVLGEGEVTLYEIIECLENGKDPSGIPGLSFYRGEKITTAPRRVIEDLSILPMPAYHLLDMNFYTMPRTSIIRYSIFSGVDVQTTRGCPCNCTYCGNPTLWEVHHYNKRFRCRPIEKVLDEIEYLYHEYKIDSFFVNDDSFTTSNARVAEFCEGLKKRKLHHLIWGIQTRVNIFTEQMAEAIANAGCVQAEFGVESGSQRILNLMKKGITVEQVERAFGICRKYGIRTFANFMINTPTETEEDMNHTVCLAKKIKATNYGFFVTVPLLGTEIYEEYVHPKLTKEEYSLYLGSTPYKQIVDPRFKLCKHNKNMSILAMTLFLRFTALPMYFDPMFSLFRHFNVYMKSAHRKLYMIAFFDIFFRRMVRHVGTFFNIMLKTVKNFFSKS
ncbi:MAG: B12-binding domain-containing radical SAM protein [Deltaproteobacteria bacterium]|nr:B12-binding domain-containing radical SAM protein [Deltaproteobacteria bacterium]